MLLPIILLTAASGLLSLAGATLLAQKKQWKNAFSLQLTAFSSGVLLAIAFLHLGPEAVHELGDEQAVFGAMLVAILFFFGLERLVLWYHHHHLPHGPRPTAYLVMVGDTLHNFIDGVLIAGTFLISPQLGIITAIAVAIHELPQEIADFSIMVSSGLSKMKALALNAVSALAAVAGGIAMYLMHETLEPLVPYAIAFAAGMFIYIALADLVPELHTHTKEVKEKWIQLALLLLGVFIIIGMTQILPDPHDEIEDDHDDEPIALQISINDQRQ